jgi:sulfatase maturation enzyme AslB (radical SAM superfamily)
VIEHGQYCVYLNNFPYIDNYGRMHLCCKNKNYSLPYNIKEHTLEEMFYSPEMEAIRNTMLRDEIPKGCEQCYKSEAKGDNSFRFRAHAGVRIIEDENTPNIKVPYQDKKIRALDLRLGSTCNLSCVMCHPTDSNSWYKIYAEYAKTVEQRTDSHVNWSLDAYNPKNLNWAEHEESWKNIFSSIDENMVKIYLAGGEPFYIRNFEEYVIELTNRCPNAVIEINTNATRKLPEKYIKKLKNKKIQLRVSIDGYGDVDEYVRQGTKWDEKVEIIKQYAENFKINSFDVTLNAFNIRQSPKLIDWLFKNFDAKILVRPVLSKEELKINSIPNSMRDSALSYFTKLKSLNDAFGKRKFDNIEQIITCLKEDLKTSPNQKAAMNFWDNMSNVKLEDFDKELADWINENSSS